jgi:hypothetical protein
MKNVKIIVKGSKMTIEVDLAQDFGKSQGGVGKNTIVASTCGNIPVFDADGNAVNVGLNVYKTA